MRLYRVFPWRKEAEPHEEGGPLHVPRKRQGSQRHDIPDLDGVIYSSQVALSAVVEYMGQFHGSVLENDDFITPFNETFSLVEYEFTDEAKLMDLDDPKTLVQFDIRPSEVLTRKYSGTRKISERFWRQGASGFIWPSSYEASWQNVTLFESRVRDHLKLSETKIQNLNVSLKEVVEAAARLKITLDR